MIMNKREKTEFEAMQARIAELELQVKGQAIATIDKRLADEP